MVVSVSTFSVVEVGNVQRKTDRHDGYTDVGVCVETALLLPPFGRSFVRLGSQKWYVASLDTHMFLLYDSNNLSEITVK